MIRSMEPLLCTVIAFFTYLVPFLRLVFAEAQVPAMFVFGDSLIDPGNNNNLATLAKANYFPNGIDFPEGATGRFCNGRTTADYLSTFLNASFLAYQPTQMLVDS
jgi:GDSL-like Lipase/Acylhydrolase